MVRYIVGQGLVLEVYTNNPITLAVLGFQRPAVLRHHQRDQLVDEGRILVDGGLVVEGLGDDEMEVPILGVAEDDGVVVTVLSKQPLEVNGAVRQ